MLKWQHLGLTKLHTNSYLYSIAASMKYQKYPEAVCNLCLEPSILFFLNP